MTPPGLRKQNILNGDSAVRSNNGTRGRCFYPASERTKRGPFSEGPASPSVSNGPHANSSASRSQFTLQASYKNTFHIFCQKTSFAYFSPYAFILFSPSLPASFLQLLADTPFFSSSCSLTPKLITKPSQAPHNRKSLVTLKTLALQMEKWKPNCSKNSLE